MSSPEFLYRGTPRKDVDQFTPKELVKVNGEDKLVVSATPDKTSATKFIVPTEGLGVKMGILDGIHYYLCADEDKFRGLDQGGAVYAISPQGFALSDIPDVWVNLNSVRPISKEEFLSGLTAMVAAGVIVRFVSTEMLEGPDKHSENYTERLRELLSE
jgi:hypothetical protein